MNLLSIVKMFLILTFVVGGICFGSYILSKNDNETKSISKKIYLLTLLPAKCFMLLSLILVNITLIDRIFNIL